MTSSESTSRDLAVVVDVLEQLLPGQVLAAPDDRREASVAQVHLVLPRLATEPEADRRPSTLRVAVRAAS